MLAEKETEKNLAGPVKFPSSGLISDGSYSVENQNLSQKHNYWLMAFRRHWNYLGMEKEMKKMVEHELLILVRNGAVVCCLVSSG